MHKLNIIGVCGQAGSGKDTVANYLAEYGFVKIALADPIKRFGYLVFLFTEDQLWGPSQSRNSVDLRYSTDAAWDEAQGRLEAYGKAYVTDLLGTDDNDAVYAAYASLVHWFFALREKYQGQLSPRIMLQTLGTEWGRDAVGQDVWMNYLLRIARTLLHEDGNTRRWTYDPLDGCLDVTDIDGFLRWERRKISGVVVSDIRFGSEIARIRDVGGAVIRIVRNDTDADAAKVGIAGHASEMHNFTVDNFDFILNNDGTLVDLYRAMDAYMLAFSASHH